MDETPLSSCMDLTRVVKQADTYVQVKFLIQEQRLDVDDANKALNDAGVHNEMRKMLAALDLKKLSFE